MNTKFDSIVSALQPFGYALPSVSERFNATGGPELALLKQTTGLYVVQLTITYGNDDPEPDLHCVAFNGQVVQDNSGHANAFATVESSDLASPGAAREVFSSLYPGLKVGSWCPRSTSWLPRAQSASRRRPRSRRRPAATRRA